MFSVPTELTKWNCTLFASSEPLHSGGWGSWSGVASSLPHFLLRALLTRALCKQASAASFHSFATLRHAGLDFSLVLLTAFFLSLQHVNPGSCNNDPQQEKHNSWPATIRHFFLFLLLFLFSWQTTTLQLSLVCSRVSEPCLLRFSLLVNNRLIKHRCTSQLALL